MSQEEAVIVTTRPVTALLSVQQDLCQDFVKTNRNKQSNGDWECTSTLQHRRCMCAERYLSATIKSSKIENVSEGRSKNSNHHQNRSHWQSQVAGKLVSCLLIKQRVISGQQATIRNASNKQATIYRLTPFSLEKRAAFHCMFAKSILHWFCRRIKELQGSSQTTHSRTVQDDQGTAAKPF